MSRGHRRSFGDRGFGGRGFGRDGFGRRGFKHDRFGHHGFDHHGFGHFGFFGLGGYYPYYYPPYYYQPYYDDGIIYLRDDYRARDDASYRGRADESLLSASLAYFAEGDYILAEELFLRAVIEQPEDPLARFAYGYALFALGKYQQAAEAIRKGLELDPTWPVVRMDQRNFYRDPSQFQAQLKKLEQHVAQHPEDGDARFLLAYNLYFSGRKERAREELLKLLEPGTGDKYAELFLEHLPDGSETPVEPTTTTSTPDSPGTESKAMEY